MRQTRQISWAIVLGVGVIAQSAQATGRRDPRDELWRQIHGNRSQRPADPFAELLWRLAQESTGSRPGDPIHGVSPDLEHIFGPNPSEGGERARRPFTSGPLGGGPWSTHPLGSDAASHPDLFLGPGASPFGPGASPLDPPEFAVPPHPTSREPSRPRTPSPRKVLIDSLGEKGHGIYYWIKNNLESNVAWTHDMPALAGDHARAYHEVRRIERYGQDNLLHLMHDVDPLVAIFQLSKTAAFDAIEELDAALGRGYSVQTIRQGPFGTRPQVSTRETPAVLFSKHQHELSPLRIKPYLWQGEPPVLVGSLTPQHIFDSRGSHTEMHVEPLAGKIRPSFVLYEGGRGFVRKGSFGLMIAYHPNKSETQQTRLGMAMLFQDIERVVLKNKGDRVARIKTAGPDRPNYRRRLLTHTKSGTGHPPSS